MLGEELRVTGMPAERTKHERSLFTLIPTLDAAEDMYNTARSVLGSMRVARQDLEAYLFNRFPNVLDVDPVWASYRLTRRPVTVYVKHFWPQDKLLEMIDALE